ncbi:MAG: hypothetical protein ACJ74Y_07715 [Bryobacteraceae bacterium]
MRLIALLMLCVAATSSIARAADDPFVGHWAFNPEKSKVDDVIFRISSDGPGRFRFNFSNGTELTLPADGTTHPDPLGGTASLTQVDSRMLRLFRKRATERIMTITVATDGNSIRIDQLDTLAAGDKKSFTGQGERIGPGKGLIGAWKMKLGEFNLPAAAREMDIEPFGTEGLSLLFPADKYRLDIKFDGKPYKDIGPNVAKGSTNIGTRLDSKAIRIEGMLNGKPWDVTEYQLSPDDKILTVTYKAAKSGNPIIQAYDRR